MCKYRGYLTKMVYSNWTFCFYLDTFTSKLNEASADEVPVIGSTKQLECFVDKFGFPVNSKAVRFYKDGESIVESKKYQVSGW